MIRTLMALAAVGGLMLSTALAQSPSTTRTQSAGTPSTSAAPNVSQGAASQAAGSTAISLQGADQWLASKFTGTDVIGVGDEKIGDVSDVLFDKSGKVNALVVGVGGFLGIGSKDVALPLTAFEFVPGTPGGTDKLRLSMTKEQLQKAAEFKPRDSSSMTTGAAGSPSPRPAGGSVQAPSGR